MEERKLNLPLHLQKSSHLKDAQWQWQSGVEPWTEKDPTKWTWEDYSNDECSIIENAFFSNRKIADLGKYEIDLEKMVQVDKGSRYHIRRIRRQGQSRLMMEIPEPQIIVKDAKTMHQAFGTVEQFLSYIMKRTPEAFKLYLKLKDLKLDCKATECEDIVREVVACIGKAAQARARIIKVRSTYSEGALEYEAKMIMDEIKSNAKSLKDFLKIILKVYTMESFICYWLNELLRSESWKEINVLTPYLVCLVYTFRLSDYMMKHEGPSGLFDTMLSVFTAKKLYLYRGAALPKEQLELYDLEKVKLFSWNGVTSTSKSLTVARKFIQVSLAKAQMHHEPKVGVLFVIKTDFESIQDREGMIDVSQNSKFPHELEVILAPGTVFELRSTRVIENGLFEVSLKVKKNFKATQKKTLLLGALQDQVILGDRAIIDGLEDFELIEALHLLEGNKLIRKLEIRNISMDKDIMRLIENMRISTNLRKGDIKLVGNHITSSLNHLAYHFSTENLSDMITLNEIKFTEEKFVGWNPKEYFVFQGVKTQKADYEPDPDLMKVYEKIKSLTLKVEALRRLDNDYQLEKFLNQLKKEDQITTLDLSLHRLGMVLRDDKKAYLDLIRPPLENLTLVLNSNMLQVDFFKILELLKSCRQLSLDFKWCEISDSWLVVLKDALASLSSLNNLSLGFSGRKGISDKALNQVENTLSSLKSLQHLSLDFSNCTQISDEGLNHLKDGLISCKSLQHLSLNLNWCYKISDEGLNHLKSAIISLTNLQHLSLDFSHCENISDGGLNHFKNALKTLRSLQYFSLDFSDCTPISEEAFNQLNAVLSTLNYLQHLSLNFCQKDPRLDFNKQGKLEYSYGWGKISDEGLNHFKNSLMALRSLQHLSLGFSRCKEISNEGLKHLKNGLVNLTSLLHLSLNFRECDKISDDGVSHLKTVITPLTNLQELSLDFSHCKEISNEGLNHLKNALIALRSLQRFTLNLECVKISDEGLNPFITALFKKNFRNFSKF